MDTIGVEMFTLVEDGEEKTADGLDEIGIADRATWHEKTVRSKSTEWLLFGPIVAESVNGNNQCVDEISRYNYARIAHEKIGRIAAWDRRDYGKDNTEAENQTNGRSDDRKAKVEIEE